MPGRTENLHDYLFPSIGDVPAIESLLVEDPEPPGPHGAKGIGEPALIPTAPAILNAVHHAAGIRLRRVPILAHRVREAVELAIDGGSTVVAQAGRAPARRSSAGPAPGIVGNGELRPRKCKVRGRAR